MSKSIQSSYESSYSFSSTKKFLKITSTGNLDLELTLLLNSQEAQLFKVFPDKINSISDCEKFLKPFSQQMHHMTFKSEQYTNSNIFDFIRLSSENMTINSLLVLNRVLQKKAFIEFILLSDMRFKPENAYLKDVVKTVCENNFLFLVENNLLPSLNLRVKFTIKIDDRVVKVFENICENSSKDSLENNSNNEGVIKEFDTEAHNNYFDDNENENENDNENQRSIKDANESKSNQESKLTQKSENNVKLRQSVNRSDSIENNVEKQIISNTNLKTGSNYKIDVKSNNSNRDSHQVNLSISKLNDDKSNVNSNEPNNKDINLTSISINKNNKALSRNSLVTENNYDSILDNDNDNRNENENKLNYSNKSSLKNSLNFQEKLIADQAELIELEQELAQNQLINENANRSNFNDELDETTNKILDSIPNEAKNDNDNENDDNNNNNNDSNKSANLENQSKISMNPNESQEKEMEKEALRPPGEMENSNSKDKSINANSNNNNNNNNIIIQENFYRNSIGNEQLNDERESKAIEDPKNISKSKHSLKSQNQSLTSVSNLNSLKSPAKNYSLNESPIKSDKGLNYSNTGAARKRSKNSFNVSSKINNNTTSFSLSLREKEAASAYEKFNYDFSASDYFFVDLNDILDLKNFNFSLSNFNALLSRVTEIHKQTKIIISFPNIISKTALLDFPTVSLLTDIISLTDIFLFEKKDALALFNLLAQVNSESPSMDERKNLEHLFIKEIKKKRKALPKIGIFLDGFKKATVIEQQASSNLILFHTDYEFSLVPRNAAKSVAETYRKLFVVHADNLKSTFFGGLFSQLLYKKPFPAAFTAANESVKKILELKRLGLEPPLDPGFYLVKIAKDSSWNFTMNRVSAVAAAATEEKIKQRKEQRFVLDCGNVMNSRMKEYNSLFDANMSGYFSSRKIRGHLQKKGFISKSNEIIEDPDAMKLGIIQSRNLSKIYEEEKANLLKISDKKEKLRLQIKNLLQGDNLVKSGNIQEIESLTKVFNFSPQAIKKLPRQQENDKFNISSFKKDLQKKINFRSTDLTYKQVENRIKQGSKGKGGFAAPKRTEGQKMLLQTLGRIEDSIIFDADFDYTSSFKGSLKGSFNFLNSTSIGGSCGVVILEEDENKFGLNKRSDTDCSVDVQGNEVEKQDNKNININYNYGENKNEHGSSYKITGDFLHNRDINNLSKVDSKKQMSNRSIQENTNSHINKNTNDNYNHNSTLDINLDTKDKKLSADNSRITNSNYLNDANNHAQAKITKTKSDDSYLNSNEINTISPNFQIKSEIEDAEEKEKDPNYNTYTKSNPDDYLDPNVNNSSENKSAQKEILVNLSNISNKKID